MSSQLGPGGTAAIRMKGMGVFNFALAGLMLINISRIHDYVPFLSVLRPGLLLFGFCVLFVGLFPGSVDLKSWNREWPSRMILWLIGIYFLSAFFGISVNGSLTHFTDDFSRVLTFYFLLVVSLSSVNALRFFIAVYVVSVLFIIFVTFTSGEVHDLGGYTRVGGTAMWDGNDLGVVYMIALPLGVAMMRSGGRIARGLGLAALILIPASITLAASRGAFLGLVGCGIGLLLFSPGVTVMRRFAVVGAAVGALVVFAPSGFWGQMGTIIAIEDDYNISDDAGRVEIWRRGMEYVAERPVLGLGPDNFVRAGYSGMGGRRVTRGSFMVAHNSFLQIWTELGTAGLLIFVGIIVRGSWGLLRLRRRLPKDWLQGTPDQRFLYLLTGYIPIAWVGFLVSAFFVTHGYTAMFYTLTAFMAGFLGLVREQVRTERALRSRERTGSERSVPLNRAHQFSGR